jgi:hypothetical protein
MNWEGFERKQFLKYYPRIFMGNLSKATKSQAIQCLSRDLNQPPPGYKPRALPLRQHILFQLFVRSHPSDLAVFESGMLVEMVIASSSSAYFVLFCPIHTKSNVLLCNRIIDQVANLSLSDFY